MARFAESIHISALRPGDTIHHEGADRTVCSADIRRAPDGEVSVFGDSYRLGTLPVQRVRFRVPLGGGAYRLA